MTMFYPERPASVGRLVLAMLASAGIHGVFLVSAAGSPAGGALPLKRIDAVLQVQPFSPVQVSAPQLSEAGDITLKTPFSALPPDAADSPEYPQSASATEAVPLAEGALIPIGDPIRYFLTHELDIRPQITTRTEPDYPPSALEKGVSVAFQLRLYIDETGRVERVVVPEHPESDLFAPAVVKAFLAARYTPGIKDGKPVKSLVLLEIKFETAVVPDTFRNNRY